MDVEAGSTLAALAVLGDYRAPHVEAQLGLCHWTRFINQGFTASKNTSGRGSPVAVLVNWWLTVVDRVTWQVVAATVDFFPWFWHNQASFILIEHHNQICTIISSYLYLALHSISTSCSIYRVYILVFVCVWSWQELGSGSEDLNAWSRRR